MTEVPEDQVRGLERDADEMEEQLQGLQQDIDTAHEKADQQRERAQPDAVAGDWEDESAGAQQGDDAQDAEGGASVSDAPVHEAKQVEPGEGGRSEEDDAEDDDDRDDGERGGAVSLDDVPVHEAEQVDPDGSGD